MKKLFLVLLPVLFLFSACKDIKDDYTLSNLTEYPVTIFDESNDYFNLEPYAKTVIQHTNSARFKLVKNPYPICVENYFNLTEVKYLKTYNLKIFNQSEKSFSLKIENDPYKQDYTLLPGEYVIEIYTSIPSLEIFFNNIIYDKYFVDGDKIFIF